MLRDTVVTVGLTLVPAAGASCARTEWCCYRRGIRGVHGSPPGGGFLLGGTSPSGRSFLLRGEFISVRSEILTWGEISPFGRSFILGEGGGNHLRLV